ncbi:MAG: 4-hydroxy-tetrahydrodipicolinate reductase [Actinomycetaceae bacterium]|nr:4-hydroxy-tetrahydrodipicolinate reductase [Actinomycetaceae bacterium]
MTKVAVIGAQGRMGKTVCEAVEAAADLELVAGLDEGDEITSTSLNGAEVAVDFTIPSQTLDNVLRLVELGVHVVVGTTGWDDEKYERVQAAIDGGAANVLIAPNFALSAVLAMEFAAMAAPLFESVEVIELHHPNKVDAPSGTAATTASKIANARTQAGVPTAPDATETDPHGTRGGRIDGIPVHAVRLRGLVAHEEILLGNPGETLTIRTDSFDRTSFMPGVLMAVRAISERQGLTIGLDKLISLR